MISSDFNFGSPSLILPLRSPLSTFLSFFQVSVGRSETPLKLLPEVTASIFTIVSFLPAVHSLYLHTTCIPTDYRTTHSFHTRSISRALVEPSKMQFNETTLDGMGAEGVHRYPSPSRKCGPESCRCSGSMIFSCFFNLIETNFHRATVGKSFQHIYQNSCYTIICTGFLLSRWQWDTALNSHHVHIRANLGSPFHLHLHLPRTTLSPLYSRN